MRNKKRGKERGENLQDQCQTASYAPEHSIKFAVIRSH